MQPSPQATVSESSVLPLSALILAAWFGVVGGYIDVGMIHLKRDVFHSSLYYEQGKHFRWAVPVASLSLLMVPGLVVALINRAWPGMVSARSAAWLFATLALWGPLLRAPLFGVATLLLAAGLGHGISRLFARRDSPLRRLATYSLLLLMALVGVTAVFSCWRDARAESQAIGRLPPPPGGADNILLIVMDTVRADNLGLYGYSRDTTPQLTRWAKRAVRFEWALATAPWTFPSHCSFMTGYWPSTLGAHWKPVLDPSYATLATFLASRGYLTAGFVANTYWCSYESEMNRGFAHYEDYPLTPRTILGSTMPGRWVLENLRSPRDFNGVKWIRSQSRDADGINRAFLDWLSANGGGERPFFAFLNYLDAHEPFLPPTGEGRQFGLRPQTAGEHTMLLEYWDRDKLKLSERDIELARDSYDNCIAALDRQVGALLDELEKRGVLRDTVVVITSDHGEQFGEHGVFNHGFSAYAQEVHVPLLIFSKEAPVGASVSQPVSLRDLPATVVDLSGLGRGSPFPGASLAACWRTAPSAGRSHVSTALSEVDIPFVIGSERGRGPKQRGFTMSLMADGLQYLIDINGNEELYDPKGDPGEVRDLKNEPGREPALERFRNLLGRFLHDDRATNQVAADYQKRFRMVLASLTQPQPIP